MADKDDILNAIRSGIGSSIPVTVTPQNKVYDLFEVYIFNLILFAAQEIGATITYEDIDGQVPTQLVFRTGPGWIYRRSSATPPYTHAILTFDNAPPLEVHVGIYVAGRSKSLHELDVAVIDRDEARASRFRCISPHYDHLRIGTECKFYTISRIKLSTGRAFFGLTADFAGAALTLVTNIDCRSVDFFLTKKDRETDLGVIPRQPERVEKFVSFIKREFVQYQSANPITPAFGD